MNHIFRVIFDETRGIWVAVSELTPAKGKSKSQTTSSASARGIRGILKPMVLMLLAALGMGTQAWADDNRLGIWDVSGGKAIISNNDGNTGCGLINSVSINPWQGNITTDACSNNRKEGVAVGFSARVLDMSAVAIGYNALADSGATSATVVGASAKAKGRQAVALGNNAGANAQSTALGADVFATGGSAIAIGNDDIVNKDYQDKLPENTIRSLYADVISNGYYNQADFDRTYIRNGNNDQRIYSPTLAKGLGSIAIGSRTVAGGDVSTALGSLSFALAPKSTAVGIRAFVSTDATGGTAIGENSHVFAAQSVAIGNQTEASNKGALSYGYKAVAAGENAIAIGSQVAAGGRFDTDRTRVLVGAYTALANSKGDNAAFNEFETTLTTAVSGADGKADLPLLKEDGVYLSTSAGDVKKTLKQADNAIAIGTRTFAVKRNALAVGYGALADADNSFAIGSYSYVQSGANNSLTLGVGAFSSGADSFVAGTRANAHSASGVIIGQNAKIDTNSDNSIAIGSKASVNANSSNSIAFGANAKIISNATISNAIAFGQNARVASEGTTTDQASSHLTGNNAIALGTDAYATLENSIALGVGSKTDYSYSDLQKAPWVAKGAIAIPTSGKTGVVSVGSVGQERRIANVASGYRDTDAVNVAQLRTFQDTVQTQIDGLNNGGGVQYLSIERNNATSQAGQLTNNLAKTENYKKYINLKTQVLYLEARRKFNGEIFDDASFNKLKEEVNRLGALYGNQIQNTATDLKSVETALSRETVGVNSDKLNSFKTRIAAAETSDSTKVVPGAYTDEQAAAAKANNNYLNDGAKGDDSIAFGWKANTKAASGSNVGGKHGVAIGFEATVTGENAIAIGGSEADGNSTIPNKASGKNSIAIGTANTASGEKSIAVGYKNTVSGVGSGAFGDPNNVSGIGSYAFGNNNTVSTNDTFVLGNDVTTNAGFGNSVYLGNTSKAIDDTAVSKYGSSYLSETINGFTFNNFANGKATSGQILGIVTIGTDQKTRRLQGVSPGLLAAGSTDAVNGSQLFSVANTLTQKLNDGYTLEGDEGVLNQTDSKSGKAAVGSRITLNTADWTSVKDNAKYSGDNIQTFYQKDDTGNSKITIGVKESPTFKDITAETIGKQGGAKLSFNDADVTVNNKKVTGLADAALSNSSTDAVTGKQLFELQEKTITLTGDKSTTTGAKKINDNPRFAITGDGTILHSTASDTGIALSLDTKELAKDSNLQSGLSDALSSNFVKVDGSNLPDKTNNVNSYNAWRTKLGIGDGVNWFNVNATKPAEADLANSNFDKEHSGAIGNNAVAVGSFAKADGVESIAIGYEAGKASALGNQAIAIGSKSEASGAGGVSLGYNSIAKESSSTALGTGAKAEGRTSIAIGRATATQTNSIALGSRAKAEAVDTFVIGSRSEVKATESGAFGKSNMVGTGGLRSYAFGLSNTVNDSDSLALGQNNTIGGFRSVAIGKKNTILDTADRSGVWGTAEGATGQEGDDDSRTFSTVAGHDSYAIGNSNTVTKDANWTFVLGNNVTADKQASVYLGDRAGFVGTTASKGTDTGYNEQKVGDITYKTFAGAGEVVGIATIGSDAQTRRLQGVAPGLISATSTDAINGSQLYATNSVLSTAAKSVKDNFGGNAALTADTGEITFTNIGGTGKDTIDDAIKAVKTEVLGTANEIKVDKTDGSNGQPQYTVSLEQAVKDKLNLVDKGLKFAGDDASVITTKLGEQLNITGGATGEVTTGNIKVSKADNGLLVQLAKDITGLGNVTADMVNATTLKLGADGKQATLTTDNDGNVNLGNKKLTGVVNGTNDSDAVNYGQFRELENKVNGAGAIKYSAERSADGASKVVALSTGLKFIGDDNINTSIKDNGEVDFALSKTLTGLTSAQFGDATSGSTKIESTGITITPATGSSTSAVSLSNSGLDNGGNTITGVADGKIENGSKEAVNGGQLFTLKNSLESGLTGKASATQTIKLIAGDGNATATQSLNKEGGLAFKIVGDDDVSTTVVNNNTDDAVKISLQKATTISANDTKVVTSGAVYNAISGARTTVSAATAADNDENLLTVTGGDEAGINSKAYSLSVSKNAINTLISNQLSATGGITFVADGHNPDVQSSNNISLGQQIKITGEEGIVSTKFTDASTIQIGVSDSVKTAIDKLNKGEFGTGNIAYQVNAGTQDNGETVSGQVAEGHGFDFRGEGDYGSGSDAYSNHNIQVSLQGDSKNTNAGVINFTLNENLTEVASITGKNSAAGANDAAKITLKNATEAGGKAVDVNGAKVANVADGKIADDSKDAITGKQLADLAAKLGVDTNDSKTGFTTPSLTTINGNTTAPTSVVDAVNQLAAAANGGLKFDAENASPKSIALGKTVTIVSGDVSGSGSEDNYKGSNLKTQITEDPANSGNAKIVIGLSEKPEFETVTVGGNEGITLAKDASGSLKLGSGANNDPVKLTNLAAGDVSDNSKDVVTGAQLEAVRKVLGNDFTVNNGNITAPTAGTDNPATGGIGGTGKTTVSDAIAEALRRAEAAGSGNITYKATNGTMTSDPAKSVSLAAGLNFTGGTNTEASVGDNGVVTFDVKDTLTGIESITGKTGDNDGAAAKITLTPANTADGKASVNVNDAKVTNLADGTIDTNSKDAITGKQLKSLADAVGLDPAGNRFTTPVFTTKIGDNATAPTSIKSAVDQLITAANGGLKFAADNTGTTANVALSKTVNVIHTQDGITDGGNTFSGQNLRTQVTAENGDAKIEIGLSDKPVFTAVTVGGDGGITLAKDASGSLKLGSGADNNTPVKLTNLATGSLADGSTDAITGDQLHDSLSNLTTLLGNGFTLKDDGTITAPNATGTPATGGIGGTGATNINDAIQAAYNKAATAASGLDSATLAYQANGANGKTTKLSTGLNFSNGSNTKAVVEDNGVVKFNVNSDLTDITSIGNGTGEHEAKLTFNAGTPANDTTPAVAPSISANNAKLTGIANGSIAKGSQDAVTGDQLNALAERIGVAKDGANGINGVDGYNGKDGSNTQNYGIPNDGTDGLAGSAGRDGLNGSTLVNKVQGLRDGVAGTVVYTDESGNRVLVENGKYYTVATVTGKRKANDGLWYDADQVNADGTVKEGTAADAGKTLADLANGDSTKVLANDKVMLSSVNPDGSTAAPVRLANLASALGDLDGNDASAKVASLLGKDATNDARYLSRAATAADLQTLALAGLDFTADSGDKVHRSLGQSLAINGHSEGTGADKQNYIVTSTDTTTGAINIKLSDAVKAKLDGISSDGKLSYAANNDAAKKTSLTDGLKFTDGSNTKAVVEDGGVVKFNVNPALTGITSISGGDGTDNDTGAKISLSSTGDKTVTLNNAKLTGIANGSIAKGSQDAVTGDQLNALAERIGVAKDGANGINGVDGYNGKDGSNTQNYGIPNDGTDGLAGSAGRDGLNGSTLVNKVQGLRDGVAGTVVYTDESGNRVLVENGKYYTVATVTGKRKANDGLWYDADQVNADGTVKEGTAADAGKTLADLANGDSTKVLANDKVILSAVNPDGKTNTATKLANIADGEIATDSTQAVNGRQIAALLGKDALDKGGNVTNIGGTNKTNINDAIKAAYDKATTAANALGNATLAYKANGEGDTTTKLSEGLDFTDGSNTTAEVGDGGVVKFNVNPDLKGITSISGSDIGAKITLGTEDKNISINSGKLTDLAKGDITKTDSTDAVTGGQINQLLGREVTFDADGNVTNIGGTGKATISEAIAEVKKTSKTTVSAGEGITVTVGDGSDGSKDYRVSLARDVSVDRAKVGDVTLTSNTDKDQVNVLNIGDEDNLTRIRNVAPGVVSSDAVNLGQLNSAMANISNAVNEVDTNARTGIASAMAAASLPQSYHAGKSMVSASVGYYQGESALAVGASSVSDSGKWVVKGSASVNRKRVGASVGVGYQW